MSKLFDAEEGKYLIIVLENLKKTDARGNRVFGSMIDRIMNKVEENTDWRKS